MTEALPTWHEYTGLAYQAWFPAIPNDPVFPSDPMMGYFLNYALTLAGEVAFPSDPIHPGQVLGGFLRQGSPGSIYLVAGPTDASEPFPLGEVQTFAAEVSEAPEPSSLSLMLVLCVVGVLLVVCRQCRHRAAAT